MHSALVNSSSNDVVPSKVYHNKTGLLGLYIDLFFLKACLTRGRPEVDPDLWGVSCRSLDGSRLRLRSYRQWTQMSAVDTLQL